LATGVLFSLLSSDWSNDPAKKQASQPSLHFIFCQLSSNVYPL
jgi:hypothetical protein